MEFTCGFDSFLFLANVTDFEGELGTEWDFKRQVTGGEGERFGEVRVPRVGK
jgi:hypothetical protein